MKKHNFANMKQGWTTMDKKAKRKTIIKLSLFIIFTALVIVTFVFSAKIFGETSVFNDTISENTTLNGIFQSIPSIIRSVQIIIISWLILITLRAILKKAFTRTKRGQTIVKLINSFIKYLIAIIALLLVLGAWGVNTTALLASAGILGLVIGLGAQSLIADIIAGVFIVFEGEYEVGDIVVIDNWRGTVKEIGIRATKIVDAGGNVKIINNSEIVSVINQTDELSIAGCEVGIEYGEDLEKVENLIKDNLENFRENIPQIKATPEYLGVAALGASSVTLKLIAKCNEEDKFGVQRSLNREIKLLFDRNGINIPFPQIVVNQPQANQNVKIETIDNSDHLSK